MKQVKVDRCICFNVSFEEIKNKIKEGIIMEDIKKTIPCCTKCRLCTPYIERMMEEKRP